MLTRKQSELLSYINSYLANEGLSPSFDEMKDALGLKSKSGIHRLISGLEERGFIRRLPHRARALEVLRLASDTSLSNGPRPTRFDPRVIEGGFGAGRKGPEKTTEAGDEAAIQVPLLGRIAAGTPIEALRDHSMHARKLRQPARKRETRAASGGAPGEFCPDGGALHLTPTRLSSENPKWSN